MRTVANHALDGSRWVLGDPDASSIAWELRLSGLSDAEWATLQSFFEACEGRLQSFAFLDPADNLLASSADLLAEEWDNSSLLQISADVVDPLGTTNAFRVLNTAQAEQSVKQSAPVPGDYTYCFSFYGRSDSMQTVNVRQTAGGQSVSVQAVLSSEWSRLICSGTPGATDQSVEFAIDIGAGGIVEVYGLQVDAQPGPSPYRSTAGRGGIYEHAHFLDDEILVTSQGPGSHSTVLRIESSTT